MHIYFRGDELQKLRLGSGLVLFVFAGTHFLNHALGLISLEVMHQAQDWRTAVTRSLPGGVVLLAALLLHAGLALYKTASRKTWRLPPWEFVQIVTGLAIPFLLLPHIVNTRVAHTLFGVEDSYLYELKRLWPASAVQQSVLLVLVWAHGCIGLHHWLRLDDRYRRVRSLLLLLAVALPVLALSGFAVSGERTAEIMSDPESFAALKARARWPDEATDATLERIRLLVRIAFGGVLLTVLLIPIWLGRRSAREPARVRITYGSGSSVMIEPGVTLLEASRANSIMHASVCGGRARCSTCRVRIEKGADSLPPPVGAEAVTLAAIGAPSNVRLACQVRPTADLTIALVSAPRTPGPAEMAFDEVSEAVAAHARARAEDRFVEFAESDPAVLAGWFAARIDSGGAVIPPIGTSLGTLLGGRIDFVGEHAVAAAAYRTGSEDISVFLIPSPKGQAAMLRATHHGYRVLGWAHEACAYLAVGPTGLSVLDDPPEARAGAIPGFGSDEHGSVTPETREKSGER